MVYIHLCACLFFRQFQTRSVFVVPQLLFGHLQRSARSNSYLLIPTVPSRYCLELCSVLFISSNCICFKLHSKQKNASHSQHKMSWVLWIYTEYCWLVQFVLYLFALLLAIDVDKLLNFLVDYMCTLPQLI